MYILMEVLVQTMARMHDEFAVIFSILDDQFPFSDKQFSSFSIERHHIVFLYYLWQRTETFNTFCKCELGTMVYLALLALTVSQDFHGGYPGVSSDNDQITIKVARNHQNVRDNYDCDLEECSVIGR